MCCLNILSVQIKEVTEIDREIAKVSNCEKASLAFTLCGVVAACAADFVAASKLPDQNEAKLPEIAALSAGCVSLVTFAMGPKLLISNAGCYVSFFPLLIIHAIFIGPKIIDNNPACQSLCGYDSDEKCVNSKYLWSKNWKIILGVMNIGAIVANSIAISNDWANSIVFLFCGGFYALHALFSISSIFTIMSVTEDRLQNARNFEESRLINNNI